VRTPSTQVRTGSVSQDWRSPLNEEKSHTYLLCVRRLETSYAMFSVSLDESFGMRRHGRTVKAHQMLSVAPALCQRLACPLQSLLRSMLEHGKHFGTAPNLAPLDPGNFQNARSQRVARFNDLFGRILLTRRFQFLHKMHAMVELVEELGRRFEATVEDLIEDETVEPERDWEVLDAVHYDLNTCLRESVVVFKSFLHALPDAQLTAFHATLQTQAAATPSSLAGRARHLARRRIAFLKGQ
jgi:hypothetical protein